MGVYLTSLIDAVAQARDHLEAGMVRAIASGAALGVGMVLVILLGTPTMGGAENRLWVARQLSIMKMPLVLAAGLVVLWYLSRGSTRAAECGSERWRAPALAGD